MTSFEKTLWIIASILALVGIGGSIALIIIYGNMPLKDVPLWILWLLE